MAWSAWQQRAHGVAGRGALFGSWVRGLGVSTASVSNLCTRRALLPTPSLVSASLQQSVPRRAAMDVFRSQLRAFGCKCSFFYKKTATATGWNSVYEANSPELSPTPSPIPNEEHTAFSG